MIPQLSFDRGVVIIRLKKELQSDSLVFSSEEKERPFYMRFIPSDPRVTLKNGDEVFSIAPHSHRKCTFIFSGASGMDEIHKQMNVRAEISYNREFKKGDETYHLTLWVNLISNIKYTPLNERKGHPPMFGEETKK